MLSPESPIDLVIDVELPARDCHILNFHVADGHAALAINISTGQCI
jgi:hypothetical protein